MTAANFSLDPETFPAVADALDQHGERLRASMDKVRATVDGTGNPWGADQQGSLVGGLYAQVLAHATEVVDTHVDQLGYAATSLRDWASTHRENDENVAAAFAKLGELA